MQTSTHRSIARKIIISLLLATFFTTGLLCADSEKSTPPKKPAPHKAKIFLRLLNMPPEQLEKTRTTVEKIKAMTPEEKKEMLSKIKSFREGKDKNAEQIATAFHNLNDNEKESLRKYWNGLTPEQRKAKQAELKKMSPEQRKEWRQSITSQQSQEGNKDTNSESTQDTQTDLMHLKKFLEAPPSVLEKTLNAIQRIQNMTPEQKNAMREKISKKDNKESQTVH